MHAVIALLPGDGIGPEVTAEGVRALRAVSDRFGHTFDLPSALIGGAAIDATGNPFPVPTRDLTQRADAVLLGAVGGAKWDDPRSSMRPEQGLLALRQLLGTYANIRPVHLYEAGRTMSPIRPERLIGVDLVVVRELTGGLYYGDKRRETLADGIEIASETCTYTSEEVTRVVRVAGALARTRRGRVTSVDKANVLVTSRLWRDVTTRVMRDEFPDVALDHVLVDACAMFLVRDPARFDVIVTENLFGDILTDEASVLAGSIGLLPSASLGAARNNGGASRAALFEPIHGSAPDIAGKGLANPIGMILSVAMMLRSSFALDREAAAIEDAVESSLADGWLTADLCTAPADARTTEAVGAEIASRIR